MEAVDYIPPGQLGHHKHGDKVLQVQTEYATRPRPRITSSVVVDGRIVHKNDREWSDDLAVPENRERLEATIVEQHRATMTLVAERAAEFTSGQVTVTVPSQAGYETPTFRDTIEEVLRTVPYIMAFCEFDNEGKVVYRAQFRDMVGEWDREFEALSQIVFGMPAVIRVGEFRQGIVYFGAENLITARIKGRAFGIMTDPEATVEHLRRDFPEFFEAVYHATDPV
jgi:hypothetical protein